MDEESTKAALNKISDVAAMMLRRDQDPETKRQLELIASIAGTQLGAAEPAEQTEG
jgi:hypothetical protein